jgi:hypothetical protein
MTALAVARGADKIGNATALTHGFSAGVLGAAGVALAGAALAAWLLRRPSEGAGEQAAESADKVLVA